MSGHGFTDVDGQDDPAAWIALLDKLRAAPEYAAYKARVAELLRPRPGGRYLDVGSGTGSDALALAARFDAHVVGVDLSRTMVEEARRRGLLEARVADASILPFDDEVFDGCWADRTLQHVEDPVAALRELVRVTKPGGRVVVADPDYDTQVAEVEDQALARRVLRFRADHLLQNGTLAHRMGRLFAGAGLTDISVEAFSVVLRDPTALDNVMGLRTWAEAAHQRGHLTEVEARTWEGQIDAAIAGERFLYAFTVFLTAGTKPTAGGGRSGPP